MNAMKPVSLRFPAKLWQKCDWMAQEQGLCRTEFVRATLTEATRGARPPIPRQTRTLTESEEQWAEWEAVADQFGTSLEAFIPQLLNRLVEQQKRKAA